MSARLVPELYVFDLQESLRFYTDVLGFRLLYERKGERFAYLDLEGAQLMIEELSDSSRQFGSAPLERPLGRGVNMQIQISKVDVGGRILTILNVHLEAYMNGTRQKQSLEIV